MRYNIIGSSSKGNCIIVEDKIMLDCGVAYSKIKAYLKDIKIIFISHIHKDHLLPRTIKTIAYNYPNIKYITGNADAVAKLYENGIKPKNIFLAPKGKWYDLGLVKVKVEQLVHDVPNHCLKWKYKDKKGIYIVDTANVNNIEAKDYDLYLIENNYKQEILNKHIEECLDKNQLVYLYRVPKTHLSSSQANNFLIENMGKNSKFEYIHKSNYNYEESE